MPIPSQFYVSPSDTAAVVRDPDATSGSALDGCNLAMNMVLRGAVGALAGAAVAKKGSEGAWAAAGFFLGSTLGQYGIVGVLAAALWKKTE